MQKFKTNNIVMANYTLHYLVLGKVCGLVVVHVLKNPYQPILIMRFPSHILFSNIHCVQFWYVFTINRNILKKLQFCTFLSQMFNTHVIVVSCKNCNILIRVSEIFSVQINLILKSHQSSHKKVVIIIIKINKMGKDL
jgi:hypothetical protein